MYRSRKHSKYSGRCGIAHCYTKINMVVWLFYMFVALGIWPYLELGCGRDSGRVDS